MDGPASTNSLALVCSRMVAIEGDIGGEVVVAGSSMIAVGGGYYRWDGGRRLKSGLGASWARDRGSKGGHGRILTMISYIIL